MALLVFLNYIRNSLAARVTSILQNPKIPGGTYTIIIKFLINLDSSISEIQPETNIGVGLENESIRIVPITEGRC